MGHCDDHNKLTKRSVIGDQDVDLDEETVDYRYNSNLGSSKWSAQMLFDSSAILNASPSRTGTTRDHHHHQSLTDPVLMQKLLQLAGGLVKVENGSKAMPDSTGTGASNNLYRSNSNVYSTDKAPIEYALNRVQRNDSIEPNHTQSTLQSELKSTSEQVKKHLAVTQQLHVQLQQSSTEIEELRLERKQLLKRLQSIEGTSQ